MHNFFINDLIQLYDGPKPTCAECIGGLLGEKGLMEEDWNDRDKWKKKKDNCQMGAGRCRDVEQPAKYKIIIQLYFLRNVSTIQVFIFMCLIQYILTYPDIYQTPCTDG